MFFFESGCEKFDFDDNEEPEGLRVVRLKDRLKNFPIERPNFCILVRETSGVGAGSAVMTPLFDSYMNLLAA